MGGLFTMTSIAKLKEVYEINVFAAGSDYAAGSKTNDETKSGLHHKYVFCWRNRNEPLAICIWTSKAAMIWIQNLCQKNLDNIISG